MHFVTVIACHQSISMLLESSALDPATSRALQDRVTEGFDKARRYTALLSGSLKDLEVRVMAAESCRAFRVHVLMFGPCRRS